MNRFRTTKKKSKDAPSPAESEDPGRPSFSSITGKPFKRRNKAKFEPTPALDLVNALPSNDDFRTSLLMPKLSARFSMLREQDDPSSLLGKASDDSVLYPHRSSRVLLSDIQEVDSIKGSPRAPFGWNRSESYGGDGLDDENPSAGSILDRGRPAEGNNLFGGRQKIYKIPTEGSASHKDLSATSTKFFYQSDVNMSAFQKMREQERERERERARESSEHEAADEEGQTRLDGQQRARAPSPPLSYNRNRETSSSTTSAPSYGRISTAATSIASQGGMSIYGNPAPAPALPSHAGHPAAAASPTTERSATKSRRLYEQGLDQHLHEQQSSAMSRLEQIARQRNMGAGTPPPGQYASLSQTASMNNLRDRYDRAAVSRSPSDRMRAASPPPSVSKELGSFHFGTEDSASPSASPSLPVMRSPPLSPPYSDGEEPILPAAIQPKDRGKATAMGAFNKPSRPYDEQQFSQRQIEMQRSRTNSSPHRPSPSLLPLAAPADPPTRALPPIPAGIHPAQRADFMQMTGSRPGSRAGSHAGSRANSRPTTSHNLPTPVIEAPVSPIEESAVDDGATFLAPASSSEVSSVHDGRPEATTNDGVPAVAEAGSQTTTSSTTPSEPLNSSVSEPEWMRRDPTQRTVSGSSNQTAKPFGSKSSTPTLKVGRSSAAGSEATLLEANGDLSGLVRQHLRTDSGTSSVYPAPSPVHSRFAVNDPPVPEIPAILPRSAQYSAYSNATPWDVEESNGGYLGEADNEEAASKARAGNKAGHSRGPSAETQKERDEFAHELAERRKRVQENLGASAQANGSGTDRMSAQQAVPPMPSEPSSKRNGTLGILKSKTSQGSMQAGPDGPKAMKMLGGNGSARNGEHEVKVGDSRTRRMMDEARWKEEEEKMLRSIARGARLPPPIRSLQTSQRPGPGSGQSPPPAMGKSTRGAAGEQVPPGSRPGERVNATHPANRGAHPGAGPENRVPRASPPRPLAGLNGKFGEDRSPTKSAAGAPTLLDGRHLQPLHSGPLSPQSVSSQASPLSPFSAGAMMSPNGSSPSTSALTSPTSATSRAGVQTYVSHSSAHRKRHVDKADISEPTFLSCTSSITTINLPPGATLANGSAEVAAEAPPLPPLNPRRRRIGMMNVIGRGVKGEVSNGPQSATEPTRSMVYERHGRPHWQGHKLRKSSSEGSNLNLMMRKQESLASSHAVPGQVRGGFQPQMGPPAVDGAMF